MSPKTPKFLIWVVEMTQPLESQDLSPGKEGTTEGMGECFSEGLSTLPLLSRGDKHSHRVHLSSVPVEGAGPPSSLCVPKSQRLLIFQADGDENETYPDITAPPYQGDNTGLGLRACALARETCTQSLPLAV